MLNKINKYMNIENAKGLIEKLYVDSLDIITVDPMVHPLRIIEASKSIIGIKPEDPLEKLLFYCEGKTADIKLFKKKYDFSKSKLPEVVSLLNLEISLLDKDKKKSAENIFYLTKVSDGLHILEFLLEFSLKHCLQSYFLVWSIYRMERFLGLKYINRSLILSVEYIINDISEKRLNLNFDIDEYIFENSFDLNLFHDVFTLYRISGEKFIRRNSIYPLVCSLVKDTKCNQCEKPEYHVLDEQKEMGRHWIYKFVNNIKMNDLNDGLILNLDAARGTLKILTDKDKINFIWNYLNKII